MAKQKIPLVKVAFTDYFTDPENPTVKYRPGVMKQAVITNEKLIQNIMNHSGQKEAQVLAILGALPDAVKDYVVAGHAVQIADLCTIKPVVHCKAVSTLAECDASTIKSVNVSVRAIGKTASLFKNWGFKMTGDIQQGEADDGTGGVEEPGESGGGGETGGSTEPTKYTMTFKLNDGSTQTAEYAAGATISYPANTDGYKWPDNKPSVMPAQNTTVTEVAVSGGGGGGGNDEPDDENDI